MHVPYCLYYLRLVGFCNHCNLVHTLYLIILSSFLKPRITTLLALKSMTLFDWIVRFSGPINAHINTIQVFQTWKLILYPPLFLNTYFILDLSFRNMWWQKDIWLQEIKTPNHQKSERTYQRNCTISLKFHNYLGISSHMHDEGTKLT